MINTHFFPHVVSLPPTPSVTDIAPAKSVKVRWPELMGITTLAEYLDMSEASVRKDLCITIKDSLDLLDLVLFWEISGGF